jgi:hypothetical protein
LKGAVLKTARRCEASRGFESHPRRLAKRKRPICSASGTRVPSIALCASYRLKPLTTAQNWRPLAQNWRAIYCPRRLRRPRLALVETITLDTMLLQDYWKRRPRKDVIKRLIELAGEDRVDLAVTARIREDVPDEQLANEIDNLSELNVRETGSVTRLGYWVLGRDRLASDDFADYERELGERAGKGEKIPDWRDLDHLHAHFLEGRDIFLTWDDGILGLSEELKARFGIVVLRPDEYLRRLVS